MEGWVKLAKRLGHHCLLVAGSSLEWLPETSSTAFPGDAATAPVVHSLPALPQTEGERAEGARTCCSVLSPTGTLSEAAGVAANLEHGELCCISPLKFVPRSLSLAA